RVARYGMVSPDSLIEAVSKSEKADIIVTFLYKIIQNLKQYYSTVSYRNSLEHIFQNNEKFVQIVVLSCFYRMAVVK
ncbi:MAG: hypothetical protein KA965_01280, partial [Butyrivibrio sp.]|nr:hypothetical protein [Butyrivibrio sp.]